MAYKTVKVRVRGDGYKERVGEKIGGGFFVFRRGKKTGRIAVKLAAMPFEHPDLESAENEVIRLRKEFPGEKFVVLHEAFYWYP